jgi:hypothetical protein
MALAGSNDNERMQSLLNKTHKEQTIWFMNAFWNTVSSDAEKLWQYTHKCVDLDIEKRQDGTGLDEVRAHKFLESFGETLTVMDLRSKLRQTGAIQQSDRPKLVPITHYLLFRFNVDWHLLVNSYGSNAEEIAHAQKLLDQVMSAFEESDRQANIARKAEAPFKAAQEEVDSALADVKAQETTRENRTNELKRKSEEGSVVQQNKAKNELAQHLAEDPLPLRKAKITLEAALKKAEKARAPFEAATKKAEEALEQTRLRVAEAEAYLEEVKKKPGSSQGTFWWMEREIFEKKRFLPVAKGGIAK